MAEEKRTTAKITQAEIDAWQKGQKCLGEVLGVDLSQLKGALMLGDFYYKAADYPRVIRIFEGVRALGVPLEERWALLASAYHLQDRPDEAIAAYLQALEHNPNDISVLTCIGELMIGRGRLIEAAQFISKAIELDPQSAHPSAMRARALAVKGNRLANKK